jgi:hypothetical protein
MPSEPALSGAEGHTAKPAFEGGAFENPNRVFEGNSMQLAVAAVLLFFDLDCRGMEDSYQGMPSGIPQSRNHRGRAALQRRVKMKN